MMKSDEHRQAMEDCFERKLWNACVVNAIHCAISAADALTVFYLGFRNAGDRHTDVVSLLRSTGIDVKELSPKLNQLTSLLSIKNLAEYEERLMDESDAADAKKACERFHSWAKEKMR
jgi:hypothetical protein